MFGTKFKHYILFTPLRPLFFTQANQISADIVVCILKNVFMIIKVEASYCNEVTFLNNRCYFNDTDL